MFETLFKYPGVLARHRSGPFTDLRKRFLIHCADEGLAHATLLHVANELLVVAGRIDLTAERQISLAEIEAAMAIWEARNAARSPAASPSNKKITDWAPARRTNSMCLSVRAVPHVATTFVTEPWCRPMTSK